MTRRRPPLRALLAFALLGAAGAARAEMVEEIVAFVNGDIITRSEFEQEEQLMVAEAYRRYTGTELDERVKALRASMLIDMVDRRILLAKAQLMFKDLEGIKKIYYEGFKENQKIKSDAEFEEMLKAEGRVAMGLPKR